MNPILLELDTTYLINCTRNVFMEKKINKAIEMNASTAMMLIIAFCFIHSLKVP